MKRLYAYVIKSFLGPFFMTFFICLFVLLMQFMWKYIDDLVGKGLEWSVLGELVFYASFGLLPFAFPLSMLLASIMAFGALGESYELVAIKSAGVSLLRIMRPMMVIAIIVSFTAFYFANNILPKTNLRFITLLYSVKQQKPELILKEGVFTNEITNYSIRVDRKNKETNMLYDVLVYDHSRGSSNDRVTVADSGRLEMTEDRKFMVFTLYSGINYVEENPKNNRRRKTYPHREDRFEKQIVNIKLRGFDFNRSDEKIFQNSYRMLNINQLLASEDSLHQDYREKIRRFVVGSRFNSAMMVNLLNHTAPNDSLKRTVDDKPAVLFNPKEEFENLDMDRKSQVIESALGNVRSNNNELNNIQNNLYGAKKIINKHEMERHKKFSLSVAVLLFFFIGAPLGAIIRKGGLGMPVVISIFLFIMYYVVSITGEKSAREDVWDMFLGMWFSSLVFLPIGIWLTYKAVSDSAVMSTETYFDLIKKIKIRLKRGKANLLNEDTSNNQ